MFPIREFDHVVHSNQARPRHDALHVGQDLLAPRALFFIAYSALAKLRWFISVVR
jgi:hypothetical protein